MCRMSCLFFRNAGLGFVSVGARLGGMISPFVLVRFLADFLALSGCMSSLMIKLSNHCNYLCVHFSIL